MINEVKSGIGYIIPAAALVGFVLALLAENYLLSIFFAIAGILVWFLYTLVMETKLPNTTGNIIILFGVLLSIGIFMSFGWEQNIHGGFNIKPEGTIFALIILFFSVMAGVLFRRDEARATDAKQILSDTDKEIVQKAVESTEETKEDPKVIIVKQEVTEKEKEVEQPQMQPYFYPYPTDDYDYEDEDYEDEDEYEYEDEDEEYEYEDEWEEDEEEEA